MFNSWEIQKQGTAHLVDEWSGQIPTNTYPEAAVPTENAVGVQCWRYYRQLMTASADQQTLAAEDVT